MKSERNILIVLLLAGLISFIFTHIRPFYSNFQSTEGTIVSQKRLDYKRGIYTLYGVEFYVNNKKYTSYEDYSGERYLLRVGKQIKVLYNPSDYTDIEIYDYTYWFMPIFYFLFFSTLLFFVTSPVKIPSPLSRQEAMSDFQNRKKSMRFVWIILGLFALLSIANLFFY